MALKDEFAALVERVVTLELLVEAPAKPEGDTAPANGVQTPDEAPGWAEELGTVKDRLAALEESLASIMLIVSPKVLAEGPTTVIPMDDDPDEPTP